MELNDHMSQMTIISRLNKPLLHIREHHNIRPTSRCLTRSKVYNRSKSKLVQCRRMSYTPTCSPIAKGIGPTVRLSPYLLSPRGSISKGSTTEGSTSEGRSPLGSTPKDPSSIRLSPYLTYSPRIPKPSPIAMYSESPIIYPSNFVL